MPRATFPNIWMKRRYASHANRSFSVFLARPSTERSFSPRLRTVSSIPGIESRAPERTETSSGSSSSPSFFSACSSRRERASATSSSRPSGSSWPAFM
jgi:hypothetical protein